MSKILFATLAGAVLFTTIKLSQAKTYGPQPKKQTIVLKKNNTVAFRSPFTDSSVREAQNKLSSLAGSLPKGEPIYLFLDTPGGSITAGEQLISHVKALGVEVKTITNFAASMGFITAQNLGERLILPHGTLMSHRATIGIQGQIPGEFNTQSKFWMDRVESIEKAVAARLGLQHPDYQKLVKDEYWVGGQDAVDQKAADRVVLATCDADLQGTTFETVQTLFGPVKVEWNNCPLITSPESIGFGALEGESAEIERVKRATVEALTSKRSMISNPELRGNYYRYVR